MVNENENKTILDFDQQEVNNPKENKKKFRFLDKSLLLKQTLVAAWKSKLQLVILLLLTTFATSLVTGSWIAYQRIVDGIETLELDDANFDAVWSYGDFSSQAKSSYIINQAFSLKLGRLYYQNSDSSVAVYFDNTIIGQEIEPLKASDLKITYTKNNGAINGISDFQWTNPNRPLKFNLNNDNVRGSMYGQLMLKAEQTDNVALKNNYLQVASELYNNLFVDYSANQILDSLRDYFSSWIARYGSHSILSNEDEFTEFLIREKINFQKSGGVEDLRIPNQVNVATDINNPNGVLATKLVKETDLNPRLTPWGSADYGMNGQWMTIYRNFDVNSNPGQSVISDFVSQYNSPSDFNMDYQQTLEKGLEKFRVVKNSFAQGAAALQNRRINVVNQFVATANVDEKTGKAVTAKVINLGMKKDYSNVNLKVFEGNYPTSRNEIVISPQYARTYKIKPGQTINIADENFIVSGIGGDAYNIYPTLSYLDAIPNTRNEFIAYVLPDAYNDEKWIAAKDKTDETLMYFIPWKNTPVAAFDVRYFSDYFQDSIFKGNKLDDRFQFDYDKLLLEKYVYNNHSFLSSYVVNQNLVVIEGDGQFSNYIRGRTLMESSLLGFKYISYVGVIFIVAIVIFITHLIIKKAIQRNQISMGILKSSGYSSWRIILSYLAYPLLVLLIAMPIGWFVGLAIQVYFTEIFNTLFILPYNVLKFNFIPLLISIGLICGFVLLTTFATGYRILQKKSLMLMSKDSDIALGNTNKVSWLQSKMKDNFKVRFLLSLSKTSWRKIALTSTVIAIATLAITSTVSVPATVNGMKDNYFKTQKYQNYYQYQTPIPNMPLSKYGLYSWNNLDNITDEAYYPVSASMPWPEDIIIRGQDGEKLAWYNPLEYQKDDSSNNFDTILNTYDSVSPETRDEIVKQVGAQLDKSSNGALTLDFLTWSYSWLGGRLFSNALLKDLAEQDLTANKQFSSSLTTLATVLLPEIIRISNPGVPPGPDAISAILKQTLPGFMRQILDKKGPNAYDYFGIGHNTIAYNPNYNDAVGGAEEELVTQFQLGSADNNLVNKGFLDIEGINPETKMLVMKDNLVQRLKYDSSANVVPMVINRSFASKFNLSVGSQFNASPKIKTLYYQNRDGKYAPISKDAWYYGEDPTSDQEGKKSVWNKSANKWNYRGERAINDTDFKDSYGYKYDGIYDDQGKRVLSDEPEDWSDVNKIWLKLPGDIISNVRSGFLRDNMGNDSLSFDVRNISYKKESGSDWIKPFSFEVTDKYNDISKINPLDLLLNRLPEWYGGMLDKGYLFVDENLHTNNVANEIENDMSSWWENIVGSSPITKYRVIGIQNSYDTAKAYVDQKWANLISGYSYYADRSEQKDPTYDSGVYQWFSGKLSASDDIYDLVGRMAFKRHADDYTMYSMSWLEGNYEIPIVANSDLLMKKKEMISKMAEISLSATLLFIITTIICSVLIVIMITDSFTDQFRKFMSHMKAEGYTNREINGFTLGIFTPWVFVGYLVGYALAFWIMYGFVWIVSAFAGLAFPFVFIWWLIPLSFGIITLVYFSTFIINTYQLNRMDLIRLLNTNE